MTEDALGDPLGQRFEQVEPPGRQFVADRLGNRVVGHDPVDIVVDRPLGRLYFDDHVEHQPLGVAALGLEGADLGLDQIVPQRDAVARVARGGGLGPFLGQREGKVDVGTHGRRLRTGVLVQT